MVASSLKPKNEDSGTHRNDQHGPADLKPVQSTARSRLIPNYIPIASKLAITLTSLVTIGVISVGLMVGSNQAKLLDKQLHSFGKTVVWQMAQYSKEPLLANDHLGLELMANNLIKHELIQGAAIFSDQGQFISLAGETPPPDVFMSMFSKNSTPSENTIVWGAENSEKEYISFMLPVLFENLTTGYVLLSFDYTLLNEAKVDTVNTVIFAVVIMVAVAVGVSFYMGRRLTRPIYQLLNASKAYAAGKFDYRINDRRNDELGVLMTSLNSMGEGLLRKQQVEQVFSRYVSPQVANQAIKELDEMESVQLGGKHVTASVLFADIVSFTNMSEEMNPADVSRLLNEYFSYIAHAVHFCNGHIDKYMGDCAMIVFGVPEEREDHAFLAVACSWMILALVKLINEERRNQTRRTVDFRIGVNGGQMLAGNMGSAERMEYTVVGDAVNMASRLSHAGEPGEIIITEEMYRQFDLEPHTQSTVHGTLRVRGKKNPVDLYQVHGIKGAFQQAMTDEIERIMERYRVETA